MKIGKSKTSRRRHLLWIGILSFAGIFFLAAELLTDQPENPVAQLNATPPPAPDRQDSGAIPDQAGAKAAMPSFTAESKDTAAASDITQDEAEDLSRGTASAWGSLYSKYGDVVTNEVITLVSESASQVYSETSDENGNFSFENIAPASDYRLSVSPKGRFKRVLMNSLTILNHQTELAIVLEPLEVGRLTGKVVNTDNIVVPGYEMKIQSPLRSGWVRIFMSDIIGEFEIENVPLGPVRFFNTFGQVLAITGHVFSGDSQTEIKLVVDFGYNELRGVVYDEFSNTVPGATVLLSWKHSDREVVSIITRRNTTGPGGEFFFQGLGKGEHELLITSFDGLVGHQIVDIGNDNSERVVVLRRQRLNR